MPYNSATNTFDNVIIVTVSVFLQLVVFALYLILSLPGYQYCHKKGKKKTRVTYPDLKNKEANKSINLFDPN
jgi:hypothetical protein